MTWHIFPIIVTPNLANATPMRQYDFMAYRDAERTPYGFGHTAAEARADLLRNEDEDYCCNRCPGFNESVTKALEQLASEKNAIERSLGKRP